MIIDSGLINNSYIEPADNQNVDIADVQIAINPISDIMDLGEGISLDLVGIVYKEYEIREINTKSGATRKIRKILVIDNSTTKEELKEEIEEPVLGIDVNIWGDNPENIKIQEGDLIVIKRCRTSSFRDKININCSETDEFYFWEDWRRIKDIAKIMKWYKEKLKSKFDFENNIIDISNSEGGGQSSNIPTQTIIQAINNKDEIFYSFGNLEAVRTDDRSIYCACPDWRKKIEENVDNTWRCEKWEKAFSEPVYTFMVTFKFSDGFVKNDIGGNLWMIWFRDQGQFLLGGMDPKKYYELVTNDYNNVEELREVGKTNAYNRYQMLIKRSQNEYNGELRDRFTAIKIFDAKPQKENENLIQMLHQYHENSEKNAIDKMKGLKL